MPILSFERILKIVEIICKVLMAALTAIGVVTSSSDSNEQGE